MSKTLLHDFLWLTVGTFCSTVPSVWCACGSGLCSKSYFLRAEFRVATFVGLSVELRQKRSLVAGYLIEFGSLVEEFLPQLRVPHFLIFPHRQWCSSVLSCQLRHSFSGSALYWGSLLITFLSAQSHMPPFTACDEREVALALISRPS